ncbi:MAG: lycopene cyclase domain-containing protein [Candidatus Omnitrophica bacterium]|nr:lycopene cyclase domain-containing protein [Candidatus Omnitrophota bacterium]
MKIQSLINKLNLFKQRVKAYNISMSKYMWLLLVSVTAPFVLSFFPPLKFYRNWRALAISLVLITLIFGAWDVFATFRGHWYFNTNGVWNIRVINLPLEEVLFFPIISFCCIFTWEVLKFIRARIK